MNSFTKVKLFLFELMEEKFTYNKQEKLKSRKLIGSVFGSGKSFLQFPVKVTYLISKDTLDFPIKVGVGVSTRYFKKAVDRNRVKRLLRECYRHNKHPLLKYCLEKNVQVAVFFLYVDKQLPEFGALQFNIQIILVKLIERIEKQLIFDN